MKLYYDDTLIAVSVLRNGIPLMKLVDGVENIPLDHVPYGVFWKVGNPVKLNKEVSGADFIRWLNDRVFPEERYDSKDLLKDMNLDSYVPSFIVNQTQGVLYGVDKFWVDFEDGRGKPDV